MSLQRYEILRARIGKLSTAADSMYATPFSVQLRTVFGRALKLRLRDRASLKTEVMTTLVKALMIGLAFFDSGSLAPYQQMPFLFMCIQASRATHGARTRRAFPLALLRGCPFESMFVSLVPLPPQMSVMGGMQAMPKLVEDRDIMKLECSDRLYSEWAFIATSFILQNLVSQVLNVVFLLITFGMSGISFDYFSDFYAWQVC